MTKRLVIVITVSILVTFSGYIMTSKDCYKNAKVAYFVNQNKNKPVFTNLDFEIISNAKIQIQKKNNRFLPAYKKLLKNADQALLEGPFSVANKTQIPVSGDKHDYLSLGPCWWPDPEKTDGLRWIRRDGEINPLTRGENVDEPRKDKMFANTYKLGSAYFFSDDKKYKKKAVELLKVWFINSDTKMNPNLNYAQGLPGTNNGRGIGIIEFTGITNIITTIEILEYKNAIDKITSQH